MWLFLAFLLVPLIEIGLFIQVGGLIGLFPTLAIVILTAVVGTLLVRSQGQNALQRVQSSMQGMGNPGEALADGAMILFAGALLLTPGFFTDAFGFALLIPQSRAVIRAYLASRIKAAHFTTHHEQNTSRPNQGPANPTTIDAEYEDVTPKGNSGWTKT